METRTTVLERNTLTAVTAGIEGLRPSNYGRIQESKWLSQVQEERAA